MTSNGPTLIAAERQRQIEEEGYDEAHDRGAADELAMAGATYAIPDDDRGSRFALWPWRGEYWKPSPDNRIRELTKAGALIAAAIDSLLAESEADR